MRKNRLNSDDWLAAGFRALAAKGPVALKAEPLARELKTTKGSFYWHFEDVPAFHAALLNAWETQAIEQIRKAHDRAEMPIPRLRSLGEIEDRLDPLIRAWARESDTAQKALKRIDKARLDYISIQLSSIGLTNQELPKLLHGALIGMQTLSPRDRKGNRAALATLVDLILALYEEA